MGRSLLAARIGVAALSTSALFTTSPGLAQSVPLAPTRDELTRDQPTPETRGPSLNVVGDVERAPCPLADPKFADVRLTISDVVFNNLKGASIEEMRAAWTPYAGTERPVAVICEIRDAAATMLRNKGYLAAVQVPTQKIENGIVRLEVLYARVTAVRARGQVGGAEDKIAGYLSKLTEDEIFDRNRAERYLLLARDLPGYNVQLTLKPAGTAPGDLIGEVSVLRRPYALDATVQNLAARQTGRWGGQLRAQAFGLTGLGDATYVSLYSTADIEEQQILQAGHSFRPGSEGLIIHGQATYAWTKPDFDQAPGDPDIKARTLFATLGAVLSVPADAGLQPDGRWGIGLRPPEGRFLRSADRRQIARRLAARRSGRHRSKFAAAQVALRRLARAAQGARYLRRHRKLRRLRGWIVPTAQPDRRRRHRDRRPGQCLGRAGARQSFAIAIEPSAQYAFDPLLSFEEFTAGNYTVGRGYDPATLAGDSGVGLSAELRGPRLNPFKRRNCRSSPMSSPMPRGCGTRISAAIRTICFLSAAACAPTSPTACISTRRWRFRPNGPECSIGAVIRDSF